MTIKNNDHTSQRLEQPDRINSEKESLLDKFEDEQMTDPIPMEDQKQDLKNEKHKRKTKSSSSSEKKNR